MEVLYQSAHVDLCSVAVRGSAELWAVAPIASASVCSISLHARQLTVIGITINGVTASFRHVDPLRHIHAGVQYAADCFVGPSVDAAYRAALEVSRVGELIIDVPDTLDTAPPLPTLPVSAHRSVKAVCSGVSARLAAAANASDQRVLHIVIKYLISPDPSRPIVGLRLVEDRHAVFTTYSSASLLDVDGVRCWLPCTDTVTARTCFDVTLVTDRRKDVLCSGKLVDLQTEGSRQLVRHVTDCLIAPSSLGLFVGRAEKYAYPLYKTRGSIWVAVKPVDRASNADTSTDEEDSGSDAEESLQQRYTQAVRHSTLGLDLATRKLHKFCGRAFSSDSYAQIFVEDLGSAHLSFHGLSLIDKTHLHAPDQVYMETPVHLLQLRAYLYSWLSSAILIDSLASAFLLHGTVGYVLNCYVDHVFGEDCGSYRFQRTYDSVLAYERIGRALPLVCEFPESHEWADPSFQDYLAAKSTVLFHLLENKVDDRDLIRTAIMGLVQSSSLSDGLRDPYGRPRTSSFSFPRPGRSLSIDSDSADASVGAQTPYNIPSTPFIGNSTPFVGETPQRTESSPLVSPEKTTEVFPVPRAIDRVLSLDHFDVAPKDLLPEPMSSSEFVASIRKQGGMASNIDDNFVDKYVRRAGISLLRVTPRVTSSSDEGRLKHLVVEVEHASLRMGEVSRSYLNAGALQVRVCDNQEQTSDGIIVFRGSVETFVHNIHVKRIYGPKPKTKGPGIEGSDTLTKSAELLVKRPAIEIARAEGAAVKLIEVDPYLTCLREMHMHASMPYLVERLHREVDRMDSLAHIECLRMLARSAGPIQAFQEAIQGYYVVTTPAKSETDAVRESISELPLNVYARAEAALCVSKCKLLMVTATCVVDVSNVGHFEKGVKLDSDESEWVGRRVLVDALNNMFADDITRLPLRNKFTNESLTFLRSALLIALSQLRAPRGQTSSIVVKHLLNFLDNNDNSADDEASVFDDSHHKAMLLNCISTLTVDAKMKNAKRIVKKIIESTKCMLDADQTNAWTLFHLKKTCHPSLPGGGLLTAAALTCIVEMEIQELLSQIIDVAAYFKHGAKGAIELEPFFRSYCSIGRLVTPPLVRGAALEAYVRLMWCRQYRYCKTSEMADYSALAINAICDVILRDPNRSVRQNAAVTLLRVVQYRPPRVAMSGLAMGEFLSSLGASDPHLYASVYAVPRLHKVHKDVMLVTVCSEAFRESLRRLWQLITQGCSHDQVSMRTRILMPRN